jgi:hypothetical protein
MIMTATYRRGVYGPLSIAAAVWLVAASPAAAQTSPASFWQQCWILSGSAGIASTASESSPLLGAAVSWHLTPRFGVEAGSAWLNPSHRQDAVAAAIAAQIMVTRPRRVTPFVRGGVGAYVMTVDPSDVNVPEFYRRRLAAGSRFTTRTFTDPSVVLGVGLDLKTSERFHVRPVFDVITVVRDGQSMTVMSGSVQVSYHLEMGRVTPAKSR